MFLPRRSPGRSRWKRFGLRRAKLLVFDPHQVVSAPDDNEAERRAYWFLIHMEGLDDRPMTVRKYDSPAVRAREPFASALRDLDFAVACCDALLTREIAFTDGLPVFQRALWDSCLTALFKHYGRGAHPDVRAAFDSVLSKRSAHDRETWDACFEERNRRVAHPVGVREGHAIGVSVDAEGTPFGVMDVGLSALRPIDRGVRWVRKLIVAIREPIARNEERLMKAVAEEVDALTNDELLRLPSLDKDQLAIERAPGTTHRLPPTPSDASPASDS